MFSISGKLHVAVLLQPYMPSRVVQYPVKKQKLV